MSILILPGVLMLILTVWALTHPIPPAYLKRMRQFEPAWMTPAEQMWRFINWCGGVVGVALLSLGLIGLFIGR